MKRTLDQVRARITAIWPHQAFNVFQDGGEPTEERQHFTIKASTLDWLLDLVGAPDPASASPLTLAFGRLRIAADELAVASRRWDEAAFRAAIAKVTEARAAYKMDQLGIGPEDLVDDEKVPF